MNWSRLAEGHGRIAPFAGTVAPRTHPQMPTATGANGARRKHDIYVQCRLDRIGIVDAAARMSAPVSSPTCVFGPNGVWVIPVGTTHLVLQWQAEQPHSRPALPLWFRLRI